MSNARFVNKGLLKSDLATLNALINYFENGGTITVCKAGKRSKANTSFPMIKGTVANIGAKSVNLKNSGAKARKG
jgi:hypothetical protein